MQIVIQEVAIICMRWMRCRVSEAVSESGRDSSDVVRRRGFLHRPTADTQRLYPTPRYSLTGRNCVRPPPADVFLASNQHNVPFSSQILAVPRYVMVMLTD